MTLHVTPGMVRTLHDLAIEAAATRHLAQQPSEFGQRQRDALLRLVKTTNSAPGRVESLRKELVSNEAATTEGITALWIEPRFVSPLIAASAAAMVDRVFGAAAVSLRPVLGVEPNSVYGVRLSGFELEPGMHIDTATACRFIQATVRVTFRALADADFVYDAMSDVEPLLIAHADGGR
ncbi:hypothetical protein V5F40_21590 [Xanthobacter sp. DSM 14520]|uniref:hypothetical protein n=1 Tax=Xanthobacter autotrophicus (strain ATCC BAA-1158 / Py2) TaxID=78245 RepID=UPI003729B1BC